MELNSCISIYYIYEKEELRMEKDVFNDYPDVLDVGIIAKMLGISKSTVYELIHNDQIKGFLIGRKFRVLKKEVIKYICETAPTI